jgi:hypothetical protein
MSKPAKKQFPAATKKAASARRLSDRRANDPQAARSNKPSKQSVVIEMLRSPKGTTVEAMMKATGWQRHSVRGFLAGVVRKRLKLKLGSERVAGRRTYRLAAPTGGRSSISRTKRH